MVTFDSRWGSRLARARSEEGATLVEIALSMTILLSTVFGIMILSLALYSYFYVSNAAREATRYAIVRGNSATTDCASPGTATCIAQGGDIQTYTRNLGFPGIIPNNLSVATTWLTNVGAACGTLDSCKTPGNRVQSTVTYSYVMSIPFVPTQTLSMTSTSQMVISH